LFGASCRNSALDLQILATPRCLPAENGKIAALPFGHWHHEFGLTVEGRPNAVNNYTAWWVEGIAYQVVCAAFTTQERAVTWKSKGLVWCAPRAVWGCRARLACRAPE